MWGINFHQSLQVISSPLLKFMTLRKLMQSHKKWNTSNTRLESVKLFGMVLTYTGYQYHPLLILLVYHYKFVQDTSQSRWQGSLWMYLWLVDKGGLVLIVCEYLHMENNLWMAVKEKYPLIIVKICRTLKCCKSNLQLVSILSFQI